MVTISGDVNNTAPPGQPFFPNVGNANGSSGIYLGDEVMIIGNGNTQASPRTYWDVIPLPGEANDIWTEGPPPDPLQCRRLQDQRHP